MTRSEDIGPGDRDSGAFRLSDDGIFVPRAAVTHRGDDYDEEGFDTLLALQQDHFWYRGRHRFVYQALQRTLGRGHEPISAIDLGGGCGGWIRYMAGRAEVPIRELALGDSSLHALRLAGTEVGPQIGRFQIDLLDLPWTERWDA